MKEMNKNNIIRKILLCNMASVKGLLINYLAEGNSNAWKLYKIIQADDELMEVFKSA